MSANAPVMKLTFYSRLFSVEPLTHTALAFEFPGGWRDVRGSVAVTVLQYLLGGGGSFSAGGPGSTPVTVVLWVMEFFSRIAQLGTQACSFSTLFKAAD